jgi:hypothetical protein
VLIPCPYYIINPVDGTGHSGMKAFIKSSKGMG